MTELSETPDRTPGGLSIWHRIHQLTQADKQQDDAVCPHDAGDLADVLLDDPELSDVPEDNDLADFL